MTVMLLATCNSGVGMRVAVDDDFVGGEVGLGAGFVGVDVCPMIDTKTKQKIHLCTAIS